MMLTVGVFAVVGCLAYLGLGVLVASWLLWKGLSKLDSAATSSPWPFRAIIVPGLVVLWPVVLSKSFSRVERGGDAKGHA